MSTFEYVEKNPQEGAVFDEAMAAFTGLIAMAVAAVYDLLSSKRWWMSAAAMAHCSSAFSRRYGVAFDLPRAA